MISKFKKYFYTPLFLLGILLPALFLDGINIEEILCKDSITLDEITSSSGNFQSDVNDICNPVDNTITPINSNDIAGLKIFFDEDSPSLPTTNGTVQFSNKIHNVNKPIHYKSAEYSYDIYLINNSFII
jgi:hypothetical protein